VLGEREQVEAEAPEHVDREAYLRPIALRVLGVVREDRELVEESIAAFERSASGGTRRRPARCSNYY
jgi:hypothetical protein